MKRMAGLLAVAFLVVLGIAGCSRKNPENERGEDIFSDNVIITETGEVIEKEETPDKNVLSEETSAEESATPDLNMVTEPEQEQVISEEDQIEPRGSELQLVFLGDSIFDNSRDGTGIPYRTSVICEADVYNLAIGGTCATIEEGEHAESDRWTSRGLLGIVKAMKKEIPTDIFEGTRTKEILDNPNIDFSQTDYFIIEYGINDFFRGAVRSSEDGSYDMKTYAGALRYAVSNLEELSPGAEIILCSPTYAQFYNGDWMIGDSNVVDKGFGTLFDYKGTCQYVANEQQTLFFNAYEDLGINGYTAEEYLEDGVHLTDAGRQIYAEALAHMILKYEETKNN